MGEEGDFTQQARESWLQLRPNEDMSTFDVSLRIRRLALILNNRLDDLAAAHGLSVFGDYEVLAAIRRADKPLQPSVIASSLKLTRAGITGRLNRLETQGFIRRKNATADARSVLVTLTADGVRCIDHAFEAMHDERAVLFDPLDESEQLLLADLLKRVLVGANDTA